MAIESIGKDKLKLMGLSFSKDNAQKVIDVCLDIKNKIAGLNLVDDHDVYLLNKYLNQFIDDFADLISDDVELDDTPKYWEETIKRLKDDIESFLLCLKSKKINLSV